MRTLFTPNSKLIWGGLDWNNSKTADLRQKIKTGLKKSNLDINCMFKRIVMVDVNVPKVEEYTLYDLAIEARLHSTKQNDRHWLAVMTMLRTMGAKPACQIISKMSPKKRAENNLESMNILQRYWKTSAFKLQENQKQ